jgi:tetratricopeptide (TPR) repeat protein
MGELVMNARRWLAAVLVGTMVLMVRASIADDSKSADEALQKGNSSLDRGDFDKALSDFTKAIQLDPKLADNCRKIRSWNK